MRTTLRKALNDAIEPDTFRNVVDLSELRQRVATRSALPLGQRSPDACCPVWKTTGCWHSMSYC